MVLDAKLGGVLQEIDMLYSYTLLSLNLHTATAADRRRSQMNPQNQRRRAGRDQAPGQGRIVPIPTILYTSII